jgi:hypothetical protein
VDLVKGILSAYWAFMKRTHTLISEVDRFSAARLFGKLVNICTDLPCEPLVSSAVLAAISGWAMALYNRKRLVNRFGPGSPSTLS